MDSMNIFDLIIAASGVYLIYVAVMMKRTGEIKSGVIVSKEVDVNHMRDKEGFIGYMYGKLIVIGILTVAVGAGSIINTNLNGPAYVSLIGIGAYLVVLILYVAAFNKAKKKFIDP